MTTETEDTSEGIGTWTFVVSGLSFILLLGVAFGLIAIVWAFVSDKRGRKLFIEGLGIHSLR